MRTLRESQHTHTLATDIFRRRFVKGPPHFYEAVPVHRVPRLLVTREKRAGQRLQMGTFLFKTCHHLFARRAVNGPVRDIFLPVRLIFMVFTLLFVRARFMNAQQIKNARIKIGLSQAELAGKVGVSQPLVSTWERGRASPSEEQRKKLTEVVGGSGPDSITDASPLAAWLTKARIAKGFSVPELAHLSGLTSPAIYRIEAGITRNLREATRKKLEAALASALPADAAKEVAQESEVAGLGKFEDFDPHLDADRPTGPGIYVLYDISERPIYVGKGANVRKRIADHEEKFWFKHPIIESASWIRVDDVTLRTQIEALLIKFLKSNAVINKQHVERNA
ncbi:MAG TPA: helix-turn-helix domain-containing protein [Chthoniobacterales bacterium]